MRLAARLTRLERVYAEDLGPSVVEKWLRVQTLLARFRRETGDRDGARVTEAEVARLEKYLAAGRYDPRIEDDCRQQLEEFAVWWREATRGRAGA
jgi:hypothetical protein